MSSDNTRHDRDPIEGCDGSPTAAADPAADISSATEALRRAKAELRKAQEVYEDIRRRAAQRVEAVRKTTVGELLDGTMGLIKKHPGPGLLAAAATGFFLGRWLKR
ncbi:MAG: hypothetical protein ABR915_11360 [Thermoguttaceae bacterium]|jgi:ElaB/YqjD/DUF883 family membrane-anchored ribosome-binding protein